MARADLLIKLVKAGLESDKVLFGRLVEALISEERGKQHHVVADHLSEIIKDKQVARNSKESSNYRNLLDEKLDSFLVRIYPKKNLEDIILKTENSRIIKEFVEEHHRSDILRSYNLEPRNRILLIGSPGNGKTSLAEGIAQALMIPFYVVKYEGIIGSFLGETASRLKSTFDFLKTQECVIFFDEFDAIGKERGDVHETGEIKRVVSSLLLQIDRLPSYNVIIAATNHPELLDKAVWRRFQIKLELPKPTKLLIENWLRIFESKLNHSLQYSPKTLAEKLVGLSFSEIEDFVLNIQRKYILSLPEVNVKRIVEESLSSLPSKYSSKNG